MLLSGEMQYRRVRGHHGGFSQFGEGTRNKKKVLKRLMSFLRSGGLMAFACVCFEAA